MAARRPEGKPQEGKTRAGRLVPGRRKAAAPQPPMSGEDDGLLEQAAQNGSGALPSRKGLLQIASVLFLLLTHVSAFMVGYYITPPRPQKAAPQFTREVTPSQVTKRLGRRGNSFNTSVQAQEMLTLMVESPGHKLYTLHYVIGQERFIFLADLAEQVLSRSVVLPDGSGRQERWQGRVLQRLQRAAAGKDLQLEADVRQGYSVRSIQRNTTQGAP